MTPPTLSQQYAAIEARLAAIEEKLDRLEPWIRSGPVLIGHSHNYATCPVMGGAGKCGAQWPAPEVQR